MLVAGDLRFGSYTDKESGVTRETRDVVAENVGASLKFTNVGVDRAPKANGPAAAGPVAKTGAVRRLGHHSLNRREQERARVIVLSPAPLRSREQQPNHA